MPDLNQLYRDVAIGDPCPLVDEDEPVVLIGDGFWYPDNWMKHSEAHGSGWCRVTLIIEWSEEHGHFVLDLVCDGPPKDHWLAFVIEMSGVDSVLGFGSVDFRYGSNTVERQLYWMMTYGVVPGQWFTAHVEFHAWRDYFGEHDDSIDWEILDREPVGDELTLARIEEALEHAQVQA